MKTIKHSAISPITTEELAFLMGEGELEHCDCTPGTIHIEWVEEAPEPTAFDFAITLLGIAGMLLVSVVILLASVLGGE